MSKRFVIVQNSLKTVYLFRYSYLKKLVRLGDVVVIAPNDDAQSLREIEKLGITVLPIPCSGGGVNRVWAYFLMNFFIIRERFYGSVIICHFIVTLITCFFSLLPFNKKLLISIEGLGTIFSKPSIFRTILSFILRRSSAIKIFCNQDECKALGGSEDEVAGGIGINLQNFPRKLPVSLIEGRFHLLYVGRLIKDKGIFDAIEVFRRLKSKGYPVVLDLVGDIYPSNPTSLTCDDIQNLKLEFGSSIHLEGFSRDVLSWYQKGHILILPSIREGFPVCVMEASSVGLPIVGYDVPGMRDAIIRSENGILVDFGDIDNLTECTRNLLSIENLEAYRLSSAQIANMYFCQEDKSQDMVARISDLCD